MKNVNLAILFSAVLFQYAELGYAMAHKYPQADAGILKNAIADQKKTIGCSKMCEVDTSPCDEPLFKKVDGRCGG